MKWQVVALALCIVLAGGGSLLAIHDGHDDEGPKDLTFNVNKNGEVNIRTDVKIGNQAVKGGKYMLTHRIEDNRHVFVLTEINKKRTASQLATIELISSFQSNREPVKSSTFFAKEQRDFSYEVIKIQLVGENGDHLFAKSTGGSDASLSRKN